MACDAKRCEMDEQASQPRGGPIDSATVRAALSLVDHPAGRIDGGYPQSDGSTTRDEHVVHVFLSYSRKDLDRANWLRDRLMSEGFEVSADGKRLVTYSRDGELALWDAATVTSGGRLPVGPNGFNIAAFIESGARLVTLDLDGSADIWDVTRGSHIAKLGQLPGKFRHVAVSVDGARVATVGDDKTIRIWNGADGAPIASYSGDFNYVTFDRSRTKIAASNFDGLVSVIRLEDGHVDTARFAQQLTNAVILSPDGSEYVVTGNDGTAIIATAATGKARLTLAIKQHPVPFRGAVYSPDGSRLITTHDDNVLRMWNAATGEQTGEFRGHTSAVSAIHVFGDGHLLLSSSDDHTICLWNTDDQSLIRKLTVHAGQVMDAVPVPDRDIVISVDRDGALFSSGCLGCRSEEGAVQAARARLKAVASHSIVDRSTSGQ